MSSERAHLLAGVVLTGVVAAGTACGVAGDGDAGVARRDSAGISIVTNTAPDRTLDWTFTRRFALGGEDSGPQAFYAVYPGYVATDASGRIYVLDSDNHRVVAFDARGRHLWTAGREGSGPGEFKSPTAVVAWRDSIGVVDAGGMKVERFNRTGDGIGADHVAQPPFLSSFGAVGSALVVDFRPAFMSDTAHERLFVVSATDTIELASLQLDPDRRVTFEHCPVRVMMPPVFGADIIWAARESTIAVAASPAYAVAMYRGTQLRASVRRAIDLVATTPSLAAAEYPTGLKLGGANFTCDISAREAVEKRGFGPFVPTIRGLAIMSDGTLWVQRTRTDSGRATFDILSRDGAYRGSVRRAPVPVAFLPDGALLAVEKDELDIRRVVVYDIQGR